MKCPVCHKKVVKIKSKDEFVCKKCTKTYKLSEVVQEEAGFFDYL